LEHGQPRLRGASGELTDEDSSARFIYSGLTFDIAPRGNLIRRFRMKKGFFVSLACGLLVSLASPVIHAQGSPPPAETEQAPASAAKKADDATAANNTKAAAAHVALQARGPRPPDFLEHLVDQILDLFNVRSSENTVTHFVIAALFLAGALLLRRVVTGFLFGFLKKLASRTRTTLDDKLLPALEAPVGTFIALVGIFAALTVLKLSESADAAINYGSTVAFSLVIFWGLLRAFGALLDHAQEVALKRKMGVAAFMPWIKKTLVSLFVVLGLLIVVQSLGYDVKALLAGLGIGGLAFALAAQDTLTNIFGSIVVAIDQPFKIGEAVKIGASEGVVEDIGLRSTKLRTPGRNLIVIPNKIVAAEPIINNSRFVGRRVEQVIALTYDTTATQIEAFVEEIRQIIRRESEVDADSILVFFRDYSASSLDIWIAYNVKDPDFPKSMALRQRINLAIMHTTEAHKVAFAFPTQTLHLGGEAAQALLERKDAAPPQPKA
jgi:MscS family membrane protein